MKKYYFAYGSNSNLEQMQRRCPNAMMIDVGVLEDYRLAMRGVADVEQCSGARVVGVIWEISPWHEKQLDRFEGWPYVYGKRSVKVKVGGRVIRCMMYEMQLKEREYRPNQTYFETIQTGYNTFGICESQLLQACDFGFDQPYSDREARRVKRWSKNLHDQYDEICPIIQHDDYLDRDYEDIQQLLN